MAVGMVGEVGTVVGTIMVVVGASDPPLVSASDLAYSGRNSHSSLLQLSLLLQLSVSLWVSVPVRVCSRARLRLWLRPLLRGIASLVAERAGRARARELAFQA